MEITHTTEAPDRATWRAWLSGHHATERDIWLVFYKKGSGQASISLSEAQEEALCFGWIDSVMRSIDEKCYALRFTPRNPGSKWSRSNRERVQRLAKEGLMAPAGMASLPPDWQADPAGFDRPHPERSESSQPADLPDFIQLALDAVPGLSEKFAALSATTRRIYLNFVLDAKREETRQKRLGYILDHVASGEKIDFMKPLK